VSTSDVDHEVFVEKLSEVLDECPASHLLAVPGVWEAVSEYFNNEVLRRLEAEKDEPDGDELGEGADDEEFECPGCKAEKEAKPEHVLLRLEGVREQLERFREISRVKQQDLRSLLPAFMGAVTTIRLLIEEVEHLRRRLGVPL
jgi:hypothetical protein